MTEISSYISSKNEIGQNALNFIQVHRQAQPFKSPSYLNQTEMWLFQYDMDAFKQVTITDSFCFFQQEINAAAMGLESSAVQLCRKVVRIKQRDLLTNTHQTTYKQHRHKRTE